MTTDLPRALRVLAIPAFKDNYLWLIHDGVHAVAVDPGDAAPVLAALAAHHLTLTAILLTHHHADHIGGVPDLLAHAEGAANCPVYGPHAEAVPVTTVPLGDGDLVDLPGIGLRLRVLFVPGHTNAHIAYQRVDEGAPWLFCGDVLFAGGCGRLFDGSAADLAASLERLATLPDNTLVYCAHEYTLSNLRFAAAVDPHNPAVRERQLPTVPSTIGLEKATNPFLRYRDPAIVASLRAAGKLGSEPASPLDIFTALRLWKNSF